VLLKLFYKIERERTLTYSFYEVKPKLDKDKAKKENYRPISVIEHRCKLLNKILTN
jgi:hypothetical protein